MPVAATVTIRAVGEGPPGATAWAGAMSDVSVAGARFLCGRRFPVGAEVEIEMRAGDAVITARARVVRVESAGERHDHGARFLLEDAGTVSTLEDLVLL